MIRQALHQCLRSAKRASKSKPFRLVVTASNLTTKPNASLSNTNTQYTKTTLCSLTPRARYYCTDPSLEELTVTRSEPELVGPAGPTPRGVKKLSFLDDRAVMRVTMPMIQVYRCDPSMRGKDPARVIRDALARALMLYYPLAGRLREGVNGRMSVACTGEGVWFVEADADVELSQLGDPPQPHLPWFEDFLYNVPPFFGGILDSPLLYIQVTRLKCGSFALALRINHVMCDGAGLTQFLNAVGEIARGAHAPSITPVWNRELFSASDSTSTSHDEQEHPPTKIITPVIINPNLVQHSIFLGPSKLLSIRRLTLEHATTFEILTACLWRCRTPTLDLHPEDNMFLGFPINARDKTNDVIPDGYYGNAFAGPVIATSARELCEGPIEYAIGLVKKAKEEGTKEYMSWRTDTPIVTGIPPDISFDKFLYVSDIRGLGYDNVDFGWGKAVYAGLAKPEVEGFTSYAPYKKHNGEDGIVVTLCLQAQTMGSLQTKVHNICASV